MPSRCLLDDPLPENIHTIKACDVCNQGFSKDESYLACFVEVVINGSIEHIDSMRPKVRSALSENPGLAARIRASRRETPGCVVWVPELDRISRIVEKLAQGHAAYELAEPHLGNKFDRASSVDFWPMATMSENDRQVFENSTVSHSWPEVGSRAMQRLVTLGSHRLNQWISVQPNRYRYMTSPDGPTVRIVLSEYLACEVSWN